MSNTLNMDQAIKRAEKVLQLANDMNKAFSPEWSEEHLKLAIAAGIADAFNHGCNHGYEAGKLSVRIG